MDFHESSDGDELEAETSDSDSGAVTNVENAELCQTHATVSALAADKKSGTP